MSPEQHRQPGRAVAIVNFLQFAMEHGPFFLSELKDGDMLGYVRLCVNV